MPGAAGHIFLLKPEHAHTDSIVYAVYGDNEKLSLVRNKSFLR